MHKGYFGKNKCKEIGINGLKFLHLSIFDEKE